MSFEWNTKFASNRLSKIPHYSEPVALRTRCRAIAGRSERFYGLERSRLSAYKLEEHRQQGLVEDGRKQMWQLETDQNSAEDCRSVAIGVRARGLGEGAAAP